MGLARSLTAGLAGEGLTPPARRSAPNAAGRLGGNAGSLGRPGGSGPLGADTQVLDLGLFVPG